VKGGVNAAVGAVDRRSLPQQVAARLHAQIADGTYPGGARLPHQRDLAASFGVSIAVAREALALLTAGGLVRTRSGQGTFVTDQPGAALRFPTWMALPTGPDELAEAIEARDVIELATATRAARRRSAEDVLRLREIMAAMRAAGDDVDAFIESDLALHLALAAAAQNRPLAGALAALQRVLRETVALGVRTAIEDGWSEALAEKHAHLVEAVADHDPEAASAAMHAMLHRLQEIAAGRGIIESTPLDP
jgi:GntR family transcriptional regulator, transcriptional repressor for pyruvate dehydrogenase complex